MAGLLQQEDLSAPLNPDGQGDAAAVEGRSDAAACTPLPSSLSAPVAPPRKNIIMRVCIFILVMELAERLCFYTFSGSMPIFLRDYLGFSQAAAAAQNSVFNSLVYLTPLLGGYVADAWLGRYWTIALFGSCYLLGTAGMALAAWPPGLTPWLFMLSFFGLVALGAGGIKSNVVTMGGDQFNLAHPSESAQKDSYFIYFYWVINVGALVSYFVLAQMATDPQAFGLQQGYGFFYTFAIAALALALALTAFFSASGRYICRPPSGSATAAFCGTIWRAAWGLPASAAAGGGAGGGGRGGGAAPAVGSGGARASNGEKLPSGGGGGVGSKSAAGGGGVLATPRQGKSGKVGEGGFMSAVEDGDTTRAFSESVFSVRASDSEGLLPPPFLSVTPGAKKHHQQYESHHHHNHNQQEQEQHQQQPVLYPSTDEVVSSPLSPVTPGEQYHPSSPVSPASSSSSPTAYTPPSAEHHLSASRVSFASNGSLHSSPSFLGGHHGGSGMMGANNRHSLRSSGIGRSSQGSNWSSHQSRVVIDLLDGKSDERRCAQQLVAGTAVLFLGVAMGVLQPFLNPGPAQDYLSYLAAGCAIFGLVLVLVPTVGTPTWLLRSHGRSAMLAARVLPVLFNTVTFQVVYAAMYYFPLSACQMNVAINLNDFGGGGGGGDDDDGKGGSNIIQINASMLNAADCIAIITMVPVLDSVVYPAVDRWLGRKCRGTEKYLFGLLVGTAAVAAAAWLEVKRRHAPIVSACGGGGDDDGSSSGSGGGGSDDDGLTPLADDVAPSPQPSPKPDDDDFYASREGCYSQCAYTGTQMSDVSVWWMALPFFLVGTAECLCNIPVYELCYSQTPPAFRSMAQAVFLFVTAVGSMLTGAFTTSLSRYITDDLNDGHLEYLYYTCIAFIAAFAPVNIFCFSLFEEIDERLVESLGNADTAAEFAPLDYWGVTLPPTADENDDGGDNDEEGDADDDDEERRTGGGSSSSGNGGLLAGGSFASSSSSSGSAGGGLRAPVGGRSSVGTVSLGGGGGSAAARRSMGRYSFGGAGGGSITL